MNSVMAAFRSNSSSPMLHHAPPPLWSLRLRLPTLTLFTLRVQTVAESVAEVAPSTPFCRLHIIGQDTTLRSAPSARRAPRALEPSVATAHHTVQPSVAVGHALLQQATPSTVLAGHALKPARGLCFIFLFSEYNQINANSKICTSFI
jgi:hypothetical protein